MPLLIKSMAVWILKQAQKKNVMLFVNMVWEQLRERPVVTDMIVVVIVKTNLRPECVGLLF